MRYPFEVPWRVLRRCHIRRYLHLFRQGARRLLAFHRYAIVRGHSSGHSRLRGLVEMGRSHNNEVTALPLYT